MPRATENDIAEAIRKIARQRPNQICTFKRAYAEVPNHVNLSGDDLAQSITRPNEQMWQQLVRNIKSHDKTPGNYIQSGFLQHIKGVGYKAI